MRFILLLFFFLAVNEFTAAQSNSSNIFRFLDGTPTARASALGGNHVGLYNADFSLFQINPAYLNQKASGQISATYMNFLGDANMGFTTGALHVDDIGTFGLGIRFIGYGNFDLLDENGNDLGDFSANDMSLTGAYSYSLDEKLTVGVSLDLIHSSYSSYKSTAAAVSGGLFYQNKDERFSAGLAVRNLGAQISAFNEQREPLPFDISAGFSKKPEAFPFQLNLTLKQLNNWDMRVFGETSKPKFIDNLFRHILFGAEASFTENFHLRFGYDHYLHEQMKAGGNFDFAGIAFGVGFKIKSILIDISRNSYSKVGAITQISIKTSLID